MSTWDPQAGTLDEAWRAVWAEDDQEAGIELCLDRLRPLLDRVAPGDQLLDLGAGIGRLAIPVAYRGVEVWALDASPVMLNHLTERYRPHRKSVTVHPVLGDGTTIPREVPVLDGAYTVVTLQHLPADRQRAYIAAVAGRLRQGGMFRFQVVTNTEAGPLSHPVTEADLVDWCRTAGLTVEVEKDPVFPTWLWASAVRPWTATGPSR